jgi:hypothetical protein
MCNSFYLIARQQIQVASASRRLGFGVSRNGVTLYLTSKVKCHSRIEINRGVYPLHMGKSLTPTSLLYSGDYRCRCTRQHTHPRSELPQLQPSMSASSEPSVLQSLLGDAVEKYKMQVGTGLI